MRYFSARIFIMRLNDLFLVASTAMLAVAAPATEKKKRTKIFQFFGVNESGAEFGNTAIPGQLNKDYTWPPTYVMFIENVLTLLTQNRSTIDTLVGKGLNIFRSSTSVIYQKAHN